MNDLAVTLGLISFPGLIATLLADKLVVHTIRWGTFKYSIYTFVFGLSAYVLLQAIASSVGWLGYTLAYLPPKTHVLQTWGVLTSGSAGGVRLAEIAWATALAPVVALFAIATVNLKLLNKASARLKVSDKFGDENLFSYYLNLAGFDWVYVRDIANDLTYFGKIHSFAETEHLQELVLSDVTVYSCKDSDELYRVPMVYLSKPLGFFLIETAIEPTNGDSDEEGHQRGDN